MNLVQFTKNDVMNVGCLNSGEIYYIENDELHEEIFTEFIQTISSCKILLKSPEGIVLFEVKDEHGILMKGVKMYDRYIGYWNSGRVELFATKEEMMRKINDRYADSHVVLYDEHIQLTYCEQGIFF